MLFAYGDEVSHVISVMHGDASHRGRNLCQRCVVCVLDKVLQFSHYTVKLLDGCIPLRGIELERVIVVSRLLRGSPSKAARLTEFQKTRCATSWPTE